MIKGLPASGKSTWAKKQNAKRVNRDELRKMIDDSKWSKEREKFILKIEQDIVVDYLGGLYDVIVDDTNLSPKNEAMWRVFAESIGAEFVIKDFTGVDLDVCLKRDRERANSVGKKVIMRMYNMFLKPKVESSPLNPMISDEKLPMAVVFDLDGTLAHITGRSPYDGKLCASDLLNKSVYGLWEAVGKMGHSRIILSGRNGDSKAETELWLQKNNIFPSRLIMRAEGDIRKDSEIKEELFNEHIRDQYNVLFVVDDRDQVVKLWRSLGLTCLQVNYGDF